MDFWNILFWFFGFFSLIFSLIFFSFYDFFPVSWYFDFSPFFFSFLLQFCIFSRFFPIFPFFWYIFPNQLSFLFFIWFFKELRKAQRLIFKSAFKNMFALNVFRKIFSTHFSFLCKLSTKWSQTKKSRKVGGAF